VFSFVSAKFSKFESLTINKPTLSMLKYSITLFYCTLFFFGQTFGQDFFIKTKEGIPILNRRELVSNCLKALHKDRNDKTALSICECEISKIDKNFTNKQYRKYTRNNIIDIFALVKEDTIIAKAIQECYTKSGQTTLLQAQGFESEFISSCIKGIQNNTEKTLDVNLVTRFCYCQLELVKSKKISDSEMQTLSNPNSVLFYEMMYKCGNPFLNKDNLENNWNKNSEKDITGPVSDTIKILSMNGMTYVKMKVGSMVQIWLFDTGASDLLINKEMEETLKKENIITEASYLGIGEYEMANGMIDTCRKYKIDNIQIGQFSINNVVIAVTDKGKRIIVGKAIINKFSKWVLNNQNNTLILSK
jgi:Aspartyl protease